LIAEHFGLEDPEELLVELKRRQLLVDGEGASGDKEPYYAPGPLAGRFSAARLLPPISRKKANTLLEGLLERIVAVNDNPDLLLSVVEARVFGSYIDQSQDELGDVDVAIGLERRLPMDAFIATSRERARAAGKRTFIEELAYGEDEVFRVLKDHQRHLSLHAIDELRKLGEVESRVLFLSKCPHG